MSAAHDTRCKGCGCTFAVPARGSCPFCGSRYLAPYTKPDLSVMAQAFEALAPRAPTRIADPIAEHLAKRQDSLDAIEVMCGQIVSELRKLYAYDQEQAALIDTAIHALRPIELDAEGRPQ